MKRIDVDNNSEAALAADIECMPTFKVYKNGAEVEKIEGASEQSLVELLGRAQASWMWWSSNWRLRIEVKAFTYNQHILPVKYFREPLLFYQLS